MTPHITVLVFLAVFLCSLAAGCQGASGRDGQEEAAALSTHQESPSVAEAQTGPNATVVSELKKASQLADDNKLDAALSQIDRVLKTHPDHVPALLARSRILIRMNRPGDADRALGRVVRLEPENLDARLMLGYCYLDQRQWEKAERSLAEIAYGEGTVRQRVSAYLGLASVYESQGEKELMSTCYREAIALDESVEQILIQAERQFFWPNPVGGEEWRLSRPSPSTREIEKVIGEVKKAPQ